MEEFLQNIFLLKILENGKFSSNIEIIEGQNIIKMIKK